MKRIPIHAIAHENGTTVIAGNLELTTQTCALHVADELTGIALPLIAAVDEGQLLRLDAVQGQSLIDNLGPIFGNGEAIDPTGWYGTIACIGTAIGPFPRKSMAMNAIVLALATGMDVKPTGTLVEQAIAPKQEADGDTIAGVTDSELRVKLKGMMPEQLEQRIQQLSDAAKPLRGFIGIFDKGLEATLDQIVKDEEAKIRTIYAEVNPTAVN